jgi:glycosyltransferase involved in cell wall biosynthesis
MLAHRLSGLEYSITLHGPLADYGPNQAEKWRHVRFGVVITLKLLAEMREWLGGAMPGRVMVAPMGVDSRRLTRSSPYVPWDGTGEVRVFCCARLNRVKGHEELVRAVALLRKRGVPVRLTIAGEDDRGGTGYRHDLQRLIGELGVAQHVELLGAVDEGEVVTRLWSSHLFVLASHHEPLGVAIMEAMAAGVPAVVTRGGGVSELVTDGVDGVMVEPRDVAALADAMARVLQDPSLARRLSEAGPLTIARGFSSRVSAEALLRGIRGQDPPTVAPVLGKAGVA